MNRRHAHRPRRTFDVAGEELTPREFAGAVVGGVAGAVVGWILVVFLIVWLGDPWVWG